MIKITKNKLREAIAGYLFILPNFVGFFCFTFFPVLFSFYLGFVKWDLVTPMKFVMFENFRKLLLCHLKEIGSAGLMFSHAFTGNYIFCLLMFVVSLSLVFRFFLQQIFFARAKKKKNFLRAVFNAVPLVVIFISAYFFIEWGLMMKSISQAGSNLYLLPQAAVKEAGMLIMFSIILLFFGMFISLLAAFFRDRDLRFEKVSNVILSFLPALIIAVTVLPVWSFSNDIWQANDAYFWQYLGNTLFLMLGIPISMFASLGLAVLMNKKLRGIVFFRTIYFLPSICTGVALYVLWRWIYNTDLGLLNTLLGYIGIPQVEWLTDTALAKPSLMLMGIWTGVGGYNMILYLAGLQGIPLDIYEAADIDGASGWQKFWAVTWPMLSPTTFFIFIMSVIGGFQGGFDAAYIMTGGGPAGSTTTLSYYIFNNAYRWSKMGFAASIAWVLFALVFVVTLFNWKFGGKVVHY